MVIEVARGYLAVGLAHVVQQRHEAYIVGRVHSAAQRMFEHVVHMAVLPLRHSRAERELGENGSQHARVAHHAQRGIVPVLYAVLAVGVQYKAQFAENSFGGDVAQKAGIVPCSLHTLFVGLEARFAAHAGKAHKAQSVLAEHLVGRGDRAHALALDIVYSAEGVNKLVAFYVVINGIAGEVPAAGVEIDVVGEINFGGRVHSADVFVRAERSKFVILPFRLHLYRAGIFVYGGAFKAQLFCRLGKHLRDDGRADIVVGF